MTPLGGRDPADLWTRLGELRQQLEECDRTAKELNGTLLIKLHGEYYEFAEEFWKPHAVITDQKQKAELIRQFEEAPQVVAIARAVERQQDALARIPDLIRHCSDVVSFLQSHNSEVKPAADILRGIAQQPRVEDGARVLGIVAQALASQESVAGHSGFVHRDALPTASDSGQALWPQGSGEQNGPRSGDAILSLREPDGSGDNSSRPADASPQVLNIAKRRGRRANQARRDAIRNAMSKHGDQWRDHLSEIFTELDSQPVAIGDLQAMKIDLGDGQIAPVLKWADLELTVGDQRRQILDALRKYTE